MPCSGPARSASSPAASASARPSSGARTSSSTPTPCAGSSGWPGSGPHDVVVEVGPGLGSLTLALLPVVGHVSPSRSTRALAGRPAGHRRGARPGAARPADGRRAPTRSPCATLPDPQPTALVANLPYNVSVPVVLTFLQHFPTLAAGAGHGPARGRRAARRRPGQRTYGVPSLKAAWYADVRLAGTVGAQRLLAGAQRRLRAGRARAAASRRTRPATREEVFALHRRGLRPAAQDPARRRWPAGPAAPAGRGGAAGRRRRPAHPRRAARHRGLRGHRRRQQRPAASAPERRRH